MQTVTISAVSRKQVNTKRGPSNQVGIKTIEYGDQWLSGWESEENKNWVKGMQVMIEVSQNGQYMNYKPVKSGMPTIQTAIPSFPNAKSVPTASANGQAQNKLVELMERQNELLVKILAALNAKNGVISIEPEELVPDEKVPF